MLELDNNFEEETTQGQNLTETGVYDVKLVRTGFKVNKTGSRSLIITLDGGGKYPNTFYQGVYLKADGSAGFEFNKLLKPLAFLSKVKALIDGKETVETKNGNIEVDVIEGIKDIDLKVAIQRQWNDYMKRYDPIIVKVFHSDGRTPGEITKGIKEPKQIQYFLSDKFKDKEPEGGTKTKAPEINVDFDEEFGEF